MKKVLLSRGLIEFSAKIRNILIFIRCFRNIGCFLSMAVFILMQFESQLLMSTSKTIFGMVQPVGKLLAR